MDVPENKNLQLTTKRLIVISTSFIVAFLLQLIVHELGHFITGLLVGAEGGQVILHPFYNSKVIFTSTPGLSGEVLIGVSGIVLDLVVATTLGILFWNKPRIIFLPILMWGSIAYIGEGIGMLSSLAVYPEYIEDITQLLRIGLPSIIITISSILFVIIGLLWMMLVIQKTGISLQAHWFQRLLAYLCSLPLYFLISILFIKLFNASEQDILMVRNMQLQISVILSLIMTVLHKPFLKRMNQVRHTTEYADAEWADLSAVSFSSLTLVVALLGYSKYFN